jgi:hypothetical protein
MSKVPPTEATDPVIKPQTLPTGKVDRTVPKRFLRLLLGFIFLLAVVQGCFEVSNVYFHRHDSGPLGWLWAGSKADAESPLKAEPSTVGGSRLTWRQNSGDAPKSGIVSLEDLRPGVVKPTSVETLMMGDDDIVVPDIPMEERDAMEKQIRRIVEGFGAATTPEARSAFVRDPSRYEDTVKLLEAAGKEEIVPVSVQGIAILEKFERRLVLCQFEDKNQVARQCALFRKPNSVDWGIDMDSLHGLSEIPWAEAKRTRLEQPFLVRARISYDEYYNYEFTDRKALVCVQLEDPVSGLIFYGFCRRDGDVHRKLAQWIDPRWGKSVDAATLRLAFPPQAASDHCVMIVEWVCSGWVLP